MSSRITKTGLTTSVIIIALLLCGCNLVSAKHLVVEISNQDDFVLTQALKIKVCSSEEISLSELAVNVYVTEREEWKGLDEVDFYNHYFNEQFISIPGTVSKRIGQELWQASGNSCYTADLENAFLDTGDWIEHGICPFRAIVVVANYGLGAWNAAEIIECKISGSLFPV